MSLLLQNTGLPLWVWVVVIAVGSVVIIGTLAFALRYVVVRRRAAAFIETFGSDDPPERRITVRRGRVVPSSKYLSLTGSKFGLQTFGAEENDASSRARSKSPFEWWATVKDRSHSRQSQVTNDASSGFGIPSSPVGQRFYQRKEFQASNHSLSSKSEKQTTAAVQEVGSPRLSPPRHPQPVNFSRSFTPQAQNSPFLHRNPTLSRIEEASPHHSMISNPPMQQRIQSFASLKRSSLAHPDNATPKSSPRQSPQLPQPATFEPSRPGSARKRSEKPDPVNRQREVVPEVPRPVAYRGSRSSLGEQENRRSLSRQTSAISNHSSVPDQADRARRWSRPGGNDDSLPAAYWETRLDLRPIRKSSQAGKVLRKKSLKRAQIVSMIDS